MILGTEDVKYHLYPTVTQCVLSCLSSSPGSSVQRILQARILEWVAIPPPGDLPDRGIEPTSLMSPALAAGSLPLVPPGKHIVVCVYQSQ